MKKVVLAVSLLCVSTICAMQKKNDKEKKEVENDKLVPLSKHVRLDSGHIEEKPYDIDRALAVAHLFLEAKASKALPDIYAHWKATKSLAIVAESTGFKAKSPFEQAYGDVTAGIIDWTNHNLLLKEEK